MPDDSATIHAGLPGAGDPDGMQPARNDRPVDAAPSAEARQPARIDGRSRPHDIERTRAEILKAALTVFAEKGLTGARVDDIAALTHTAKPTIYYHFRSKEDLYAAVLENAYGGIRDMERTLDLDLSDPVDAMRRLVEATFDYHAANPAWVRLVSIENIHSGRHILGKPEFTARNAPILERLRTIIEAGEQLGVFRTGVDPMHLHWMMSSMCFYRVSNRHTWQANFGIDMEAPQQAAAQRRIVVEAVLRFLAAESG
jgi:AcrR family transcriptional regulator